MRHACSLKANNPLSVGARACRALCVPPVPTVTAYMGR